ncbi:MAG: peptide chain release factor-like protein [Nitrospiraceae bacterium]|nr:peptide chain release factor-like protein [Nitrospiraceae bacterium]
MPDFAVSEEKNRLLREKMQALGIREKDILEKFIRSSGHGGQKLNKTASCVYLKHLPTGIEVKCMRERSQSVNRFLARRELAGKLEARIAGPVAGRSKADIAQKVKKQKQRRLRRSKDRHAPAGKTATSETDD